MRRVQLDVRDPDGRDAFLALAAGADVVVESFRPGVVDRLGIGYEAVRAVNAGIVYCSTSGYGQDGPRVGAGPATTSTTWPSAATWPRPAPRADGGPPIPGATIADAAAGGMHAALAICAALFAAGDHRRGHLPRRVGGRRGPVAHVAGRRRAPGHRDRARARPRRADRPLRLLRHLPRRPTAGGWRWRPSRPSSSPTCAGRSAASSGPSSQYDDDAQDDIRARPGAPPSPAATATAGWPSWPGADTCVAPVQARRRDRPRSPVRRPRRGGRGQGHRRRGPSARWAPVLAGMPPVGRAGDRAATADVTDTDELLAAAGMDPARVADLRARRVLA